MKEKNLFHIHFFSNEEETLMLEAAKEHRYFNVHTSSLSMSHNGPLCVLGNVTQMRQNSHLLAQLLQLMIY